MVSDNKEDGVRDAQRCGNNGSASRIEGTTSHLLECRTARDAQRSSGADDVEALLIFEQIARASCLTLNSIRPRVVETACRQTRRCADQHQHGLSHDFFTGEAEEMASDSSGAVHPAADPVTVVSHKTPMGDTTSGVACVTVTSASN